MGLIAGLSGTRLICHCLPRQACHADAFISACSIRFPTAHSRDDPSSRTPSSSVINGLAELKCEEEKGGCASEGFRLDWHRTAHTSGFRWSVQSRPYLGNPPWLCISALYWSFSKSAGSPHLLKSLALGRIKASPFGPAAVLELKDEVVRSLAANGFFLTRERRDRVDTPIDFRFLALILKASGDPDVCWWIFFWRTSGFGRGASATFGSLPKEEKWRLPEQGNPDEHAEDRHESAGVSQRNHASVAGLTSQERSSPRAQRGRRAKNISESGGGLPRGNQEGQAWRHRLSECPFRRDQRRLGQPPYLHQGPRTRSNRC